MSIQDQPRKVRATLNYQLPASEGGAVHVVIGTVGEKRRKFQAVTVDIENMRGHEDDFHLDKQGFQLVHKPSIEKTFDDSTRIENLYYPECAQLLKDLTGATETIPFAHIVRRQSWQHAYQAEKDLPDSARATAPSTANWIHIDNSYSGAQSRILNAYPERKEQIQKHRWAIINIWRPIERRVTREALCVCDARSVGEEELFEIHGVMPGGAGAGAGAALTNGGGGAGDKDKDGDEDGEKDKENRPPPPPPPPSSQGKSDGTDPYHYRPGFNMFTVWPPPPGQESKHKWHYASNMEPDEALLIKIFDSRDDGTVARRVPHTAFVCAGDHGPDRKSLEVRCLVIWEDEKNGGAASG